MALPVISPEVSSFRALRRVDLAASIFCNRSATNRDLKSLHFHRKDRDFKSRLRVYSRRTRDLEVRISDYHNASRYGQFSVSVKPGREEEEKQNYYLNVGYAIRTLREELPGLFHKELTLDIYRDDIVFKDPLNTFVGIENYKSIFWGLRFHGRMFFRALWIDIISVRQPVEDVVMVRWTVHGVPRVLWEGHGRFDGTSQYRFDKNGKIFEHRVDNIALNSPPKFKALKSVSSWV
ncbi:hypothetical protein CDL15_Pgr003578 [Punica granatum]|uniref:Uncharacterized protein n=1 Tax=Punica granatum TaxID=22663 RepID=A0A218XU35_PUNGR|nr:hypothetical protein CDL15_Pgr003578 [Punica granatum]